MGRKTKCQDIPYISWETTKKGNKQSAKLYIFGAHVIEDGNCREDIRESIVNGDKCAGAQIRQSENGSRNVKLGLHKTVIKATVVYQSET